MVALLNALDQQSTMRTPPPAEAREEPRRPLRTPCKVGMFSGAEGEVSVARGTVRNVTFRGVAVVMDEPLHLATHRPVEVIVTLPDLRTMHMAGTVAFCRSVDDGCTEIGVAVKAAGEASILMNDIEQARTVYGWFAKALAVAES